ncbi:MAG: hypothetical protein O3C10_11280 [Chloroflexi bacterium]|nr:hypothetical protein [Chloroflexota bacterium]
MPKNPIVNSLWGERIAIAAGDIKTTRLVNQSGRHKAQEFVANYDVYCVIERPMVRSADAMDPPDSGLAKGDELRGEVVIGNARRLSAITITGKGGRRRKRMNAIDNAFCIVQRRLRRLSRS